MISQTARRDLLRAAAIVTSCAAASLAFAPVADAHFVLQAPASWHSQDASGSPQKLGPCGDEGGGNPTGTVTAFQVGQTITVTIDEKIFHPGHYRIALAVQDRSELPAEPTVTPGASTPCGSVPIASPPVFPVLADGVFPHTSPLSGPQSVDVTLPAGVTCDHCTLQVIEFMSEHPLNNPGGCFYHHCADISINQVSVDAGAPAGAGGAATGAGGTGVAGSSSGVAGTNGSATTSAGGAGATAGATGHAGSAQAGGSATGGSDDPSPASSGGCGLSPGRAGGLGCAVLVAGGVAAAFRRRRRSQARS